MVTTNKEQGQAHSVAHHDDVADPALEPGTLFEAPHITCQRLAARLTFQP